MTCGHCVSTVERALNDVRGVYGASVDLKRGEAEVDLDDARVSVEQLIAAVEAAGYGARRTP